MAQSAQPPLRCQIHMLRCGSSCAEARIRCTSKPTAHSKTRCPQLGASRDRITVNAAAPDNNFVGGQVAFCVQSLARAWRVFSASSDVLLQPTRGSIAARHDIMSYPLRAQVRHRVESMRSRRLRLARRGSATHLRVVSSCFGHQKGFPFWEHVLVPLASTGCFQIAFDECAALCHSFRNHFW